MPQSVLVTGSKVFQRKTVPFGFSPITTITTEVNDILQNVNSSPARTTEINVSGKVLQAEQKEKSWITYKTKRFIP